MEYFVTSSEEMIPEQKLTEEWNEQCKVVRDFMISLWSEARDIKCGDDGWTPAKGVDDPLAQGEDDAAPEK